MNRQKKLKRKVDSLLEEFKQTKEYDHLVPPGGRLVIISSIDVYHPGNIDDAFRDDPNVVVAPADHDLMLQGRLDKLHGHLKSELNRWAQQHQLLRGKESVCVDVLIIPSSTQLPVGGA